MNDLDDIGIIPVNILKCCIGECNEPAFYILLVEYGKDSWDGPNSEMYEEYCKRHVIEKAKKWMKDSKDYDWLSKKPNDTIIGCLLRNAL